MLLHVSRYEYPLFIALEEGISAVCLQKFFESNNFIRSIATKCTPVRKIHNIFGTNCETEAGYIFKFRDRSVCSVDKNAANAMSDGSLFLRCAQVSRSLLLNVPAARSGLTSRCTSAVGSWLRSTPTNTKVHGVWPMAQAEPSRVFVQWAVAARVLVDPKQRCPMV
jgi:hypothetical protein